jgi:hypothetical protein
LTANSEHVEEERGILNLAGRQIRKWNKAGPRFAMEEANGTSFARGRRGAGAKLSLSPILWRMFRDRLCRLCVAIFCEGIQKVRLISGFQTRRDAFFRSQ